MGKRSVITRLECNPSYLVVLLMTHHSFLTLTIHDKSILGIWGSKQVLLGSMSVGLSIVLHLTVAHLIPRLAVLRFP